MSNSSELFGGGSSPKKWVSGTTYQEGTVVWSPTDYQYFMRKTTGAGTTDPSSDTTNWQPTGDRAVKSIQRGIISMTSVTTATATVSSVNTAKSLLTFLGFNTAQLTNDYNPSIVLTNSTTITATRVNNGASNTTVSWELVERY